jgi:hypothetical protein
MGTRATLLDPADVQRGRGEVDLIPAQVRQLGRSQAMAIGHKDHRAVPVTPAVSLGGLEQSFEQRSIFQRADRTAAGRAQSAPLHFGILVGRASNLEATRSLHPQPRGLMVASGWGNNH